MSEAFLANTSTQRLSPLGTAPQRSFELISGTVRDKLGERHAALFAEPVATQYGDRFDWYAVSGGKTRRLNSLDDVEKAAVQADLDALTTDIEALGQTLLDRSNPDEQRLGEALMNALQYPGADCVYVLTKDDEKQPVIVNWAWVLDSQSAVTGDLSGAEGVSRVRKGAAANATAHVAAAAAPIAPAPQAQQASARRAGPLNLWWLLWLGWILLLILFPVILYLLVQACALKIPGIAGYCPPPGPVVVDHERTTLMLRDQIATVERQIGIADRACQPEQLASIVPDADQSRLAERGAREGQLTISLLWDSIADLHMDVNCPGGDTINYDNQKACGGVLDVGGNHTKATSVTNAIESMYFDVPAAGQYTVTVSLYSPHDQATTQPFRLRIRDGDNTETFQGTVIKGLGTWTQTYTVGKGN